VDAVRKTIFNHGGDTPVKCATLSLREFHGARSAEREAQKSEVGGHPGEIRPSTIFRTYPSEIDSPKLHGAGGVNKRRKSNPQISQINAEKVCVLSARNWRE